MSQLLLWLEKKLLKACPQKRCGQETVGWPEKAVARAKPGFRSTGRGTVRHVLSMCALESAAAFCMHR